MVRTTAAKVKAWKSGKGLEEGFSRRSESVGRTSIGICLFFQFSAMGTALNDAASGTSQWASEGWWKTLENNV